MYSIASLDLSLDSLMNLSNWWMVLLTPDSPVGHLPQLVPDVVVEEIPMVVVGVIDVLTAVVVVLVLGVALLGSSCCDSGELLGSSLSFLGFPSFSVL